MTRHSLSAYPAMKQSGVPWLGQVPRHWELTTLGRIGRFSKGNGGTKEDEVSAGIPCIRYGDLYTQHEFFIAQSRSFVTSERAADYTPIERGDLLFAGSGETLEEIGKSAVNLIDGTACCGGDVLLFRPARQMNPRFLGYASDCPASVHQKAGMGRGVTVMHIYEGELKYLWLALPSLTEQAAIVRFLNHADRRIRRTIRAKQKLSALLNEQKQAVIHRAVTRGLDANIRLKPSGVEWLGDVPAHWSVVALGRLVELTAGYPFSSEDFTHDGSGIRLLRGINVAPSAIRWDSVVRYPSAAAAQFAGFDLRHGDIVLGMDRPIIREGIRVATITKDDVPSLLLQRVARIRPLKRLNPQFAFQLLSGKSFTDYLTPIFTGISVPHLSPEQIRSFPTCFPDLAEQALITAHVKAATASISSGAEVAQREIELLREYRTRLIADVVTGKLDVREAATRLPNDPDEADPLDEAELATEGDESEDAELEPEEVEA